MNETDVEMTQIDESTMVEPKMEMSPNQVRKALRDTREEMQENRLEFIDPNSNHIEKTLERVEHIFKSVTKPREAVSEANVLYEIAVLAKERIKNVHCTFRSFNNIEFMDKLKAYMLSIEVRQESRTVFKEDTGDDDDDEDEDEEKETTQVKHRTANRSKKSDYVLTQPIIQKFGDEIMRYFKILPQPKFMIGLIQKQVVLSKNKIVRQRKEQNKDVEAVRTKIKELSANSEDTETNNTVGETERIYELLKRYFKKVTKGQPICFYEFAINPHSFSRTIENIFYISFLVKDGYAKIYLDNDKLPVIEPIDKVFKANDKGTQKKSTDNIQSMVSLTKLEWKELIQVFNIENACIPDPKK